MRIAVLSGKGGAGKTFVAVNLAAAADGALYVDCDVEEPNGHLFFKPEQASEQTVAVPTPAVDPALCTGCRTCVSFCKYNALAFIGGAVTVFADVCHACGGCALFCPSGAIGEQPKAVGAVRRGRSGTVEVRSGILNTGEASGVPVIKALLATIAPQGEKTVILDCPPGSACSVMESIKEADFCLLVAEPTVFGAHNLRMVRELAALFEKPHAVLLNKCLDGGDNPSEAFCREKAVPVLGSIPFTRELAALHAEGKIAAREEDSHRQMFSGLLDAIRRQGGTA